MVKTVIAAPVATFDGVGAIEAPLLRRLTTSSPPTQAVGWRSSRSNRADEDPETESSLCRG